MYQRIINLIHSNCVQQSRDRNWIFKSKNHQKIRSKSDNKNTIYRKPSNRKIAYSAQKFETDTIPTFPFDHEKKIPPKTKLQREKENAVHLQKAEKRHHLKQATITTVTPTKLPHTTSKRKNQGNLLSSPPKTARESTDDTPSTVVKMDEPKEDANKKKLQILRIIAL